MNVPLLKGKTLLSPLLPLLLCTFFYTSLNAQKATDTLHASSDTTTLKNETAKSKKITLNGMLLFRYTHAATQQVDVAGKHHTNSEEAITNQSFGLRRVRLQAKAAITPRADAAVLLNLTDFTGNPQYKVLELAYIKYAFNNYINVQAGQFRPYFGREDLYSEEVLQTFEWSNGYSAFGAAGWQSYQSGITFFGKTKMFQKPFAYYIGVFNGNGRNHEMDNNKGKLVPARVEWTLLPTATIGLNAGAGKEGAHKVWAWGADVDYKKNLSERLQLEVQGEYKKGVNSTLFFSHPETETPMENYCMQGWYLLPDVTYKINKQHVQAVELSMRYERFNPDSKQGGNTRTTYAPMISVLAAEAFCLRLSVGALINQYHCKLANTTEYNNTRFICQLGARF